MRRQVKYLRRDISTINLLNGLHLSAGQMRQILALAREAESVRTSSPTLAAEFECALADAKTTFADLKREIQKGSPARGIVPQRARMAKQRLKDLHDRHEQVIGEGLRQLEDRLTRVLTPEQLQVVQNFRPCLIPPPELRDPIRAGQASSNHKFIDRLRRLRQVPGWAWNARRDAVATRIAERISRHLYLDDGDRLAEEARLRALLDRVRELSDVDFEMQKNSIASELKPRDRIEALREEIFRRLPRGKNRKKSRLGRFLLHDAIIPILEERLKDAALARR
jgi:hypothetical protein